MKTSIMVGLFSLALATTLFITGCQTAGGMKSTVESDVCPACQTTLETMPVKGMTYTKCICPSCKKVSTIDPYAPASMKDYVDKSTSTVHVCEKCGAMVEECPVCRKM